MRLIVVHIAICLCFLDGLSQNIYVFQFNGELIGKSVTQISNVFDLIEKSGLVDPEVGGDFLVYEGPLSSVKVQRSLKQIERLVSLKYPFEYDLDFSSVKCNQKSSNGIADGIWRIASVFDGAEYFGLKKGVKNGFLSGDYELNYPNSKKHIYCSFYNGVVNDSIVYISFTGDSSVSFFDSCNVKLSRRTFSPNNELLETYRWNPTNGGVEVRLFNDGSIASFKIIGKRKEQVGNSIVYNIDGTVDTVYKTETGTCSEVNNIEFQVIDTMYYYPELDTLLSTKDTSILNSVGQIIIPKPVYSEKRRRYKASSCRFYNDKGEIIKKIDYPKQK